MLKRIDIPCPCDGCERKVIDEYGYMCDLGCGERSQWISERAGADIQLEVDAGEYGKLEALTVKLFAEVEELKKATKNMVKIEPEEARRIIAEKSSMLVKLHSEECICDPCKIIAKLKPIAGRDKQEKVNGTTN